DAGRAHGATRTHGDEGRGHPPGAGRDAARAMGLLEDMVGTRGGEESERREEEAPARGRTNRHGHLLLLAEPRCSSWRWRRLIKTVVRIAQDALPSHARRATNCRTSARSAGVAVVAVKSVTVDG